MSVPTSEQSDLAFYTASEVAELLRLNHQVVQRKLQAGEIPGYRIGREWRVERGQLMAWLERYSNQHERPLTDRWFDKTGRLTQIPVQPAKRNAVLQRIAEERFEVGVDYPEKDLNASLKAIFEDFARLRRELVEAHLMTRANGIYRRAEQSAR